MIFQPRHLLLVLAIQLLRAPMANAAASTAEEFFEKRIRPLFAEHCLECHSGSSKTQGGLSLDSRADLLRGGDSGPAVVPGLAAQSLLWKAVRHENADLAMPAKRPKLPDSLLDDLHAAILHLLGLDHSRLTFRFGGRDIRLTDVYGHVIRGILA